MYIQITTYCNMSCEHCCFSLSSNNPNAQHMSRETLKAALSVAGYDSSYPILVIGGGEPTMHPEFWEFFGLFMGARRVEGVWLATNGSVTDRAIALARLSNPDGKFSACLSQDYFHGQIDPAVIHAFKDAGCEIRDVSNNVIDVGSARENGYGEREGCTCNEVFVMPDGQVKACGCEDSLVLGSVHEPDLLTPRLERLPNIEEYTDSGCGAKLSEASTQYIMNGGCLPELEAA